MRKIAQPKKRYEIYNRLGWNWPIRGDFEATYRKFNCKDHPCKLLNIPPHQLVLTYEDRNHVLRTLLQQLLPICTTAAMNAYKPMGNIEEEKKNLRSLQMPNMQERKEEKEDESDETYNEECSKRGIFCQLFFHLT